MYFICGFDFHAMLKAVPELSVPEKAFNWILEQDLAEVAHTKIRINISNIKTAI